MSDSISAASSSKEGGGDEIGPRFKYRRILCDTQLIFERDSATCIALHDKFLVVGTRAGHVYVMDQLGNVIANRETKIHKTPVNHVGVDTHGDYIISCAVGDSKVLIRGLVSDEYNQVFIAKSEILTAVLSPNFAQRASGQQFVTANRNLSFHEQRIFGGYNDTILYDGTRLDGPISTVSWRTTYIAFTNDSGTRIYDRSLRRLISCVKREHEIQHHHRPHHVWLSDTSFAIGWSNTLTVCGIRIQPSSTSTSSLLQLDAAPSKIVEIYFMWSLESIVAGISFTPAVATDANSEFRFKEIVLFSVKDHPPPSTEHESIADVNNDGADTYHPMVQLLEPISYAEYVIVTEDQVIMRDYDCDQQKYTVTMSSIPTEPWYILLGSKDMIEFRPCSTDDTVESLLATESFEEALQFAKDNATSLRRTTVHDVGKALLDALIARRELIKAAKMCPEVCGRQKDIWEYYVNAFEQEQQVFLLAGVLPIHDPQLEPECYESILLTVLDRDANIFRRLIQLWPPEIYRVGAIIAATSEKIHRRREKKTTPDDAKAYAILLEALAILYTYDRKYERALKLYVSIKNRCVFALIDRYRLFPMVKDRIRDLMDIDTDLAIRLLLNNADSLPANTILMQLNKQPRLQIAYLERLFTRNEGAEFADLAVSLYAEHDRNRLLPYLRRAEHYRIDRALDICRNKNYTPEVIAVSQYLHNSNVQVVFLLGRSGNCHDALATILDNTADIDMAIEFCKEHDDHDLWLALIATAVRSPASVTRLLRNAGTTIVEPTLIIEHIPPTMVIPGLRDSLVAILDEYELQLRLQRDCVRLTLIDHRDQLMRLQTMHTRGTRVDVTTTSCYVCRQPVLAVGDELTSVENSELVLFACEHHTIVHRSCIVGRTSACCPRCTL